MNRQTFLQLIRQPGNITAEDIRELETFVEQYPYCQNAHLLIAKYYADNGHMLAGLKVKKAALYTADRSRLKELIEETTKENADALKKTASFIPEETKKIEIEQLIEQAIPEEIKKEPVVITEKEPVEIKTEKEPVLVSDIGLKTEVISIEEQTKEQLLEELQQSLIALRESRKKAFIQKEKPLEEQITKDETTNAEYTLPTIVTEVVSENATLLSDPVSTEPIEVENVKESETALTETNLVVESNSVDESNLVETKEPETIEQQEPDLVEPVLLLSPTDHYYPDHGRGPIPIPSSTEYQPIDEEYQNLMMRYFEYQNQKRLVFKKNRKKEDEIIEKLSKEDLVMPKMNAKTLPEETEDLATKSSTMQKGPISENFARILVLQGKTAKAIEIYQELSLKIPEKKAYFEAQIEKLKTKLG